MTEWNADSYDHISRLQQAMAAKDLARLSLAGTERVLDVGCGEGRITARLAARVPQGSVLGVDPSHDMIAFAAAHFGPPSYPNLRFEAADATSLPYRDEFDLVVSFNALHWVQDQEAALRSIRRALKDSGQAWLRFVPAGPRTSIEDVIEETRKGPRWAASFESFRQPYRHVPPDDYRALAQRCGLRVLDLRVADEAWDFQTRAAFEAFCRTTFVEWTKQIPKDQEDSFIGEVLDRYRQVASRGPEDANTFRYYQVEIVLAPEAGS